MKAFIKMYLNQIHELTFIKEFSKTYVNIHIQMFIGKGNLYKKNMPTILNNSRERQVSLDRRTGVR